MKIALVGDVMLGRLVNEKLKRQDFAYPWGDTLRVLQSADIRLCNLECVLSDFGEPWSGNSKIFHFRSDEKNIQVLHSAQINMVSLANNHVLDYGYEALGRMLNLLENHGILYAGAGRNGAQASRPCICNHDGKSIAMFAFTDNEPDWEAQADTPGIYYIPIDLEDARAQQLFQNIQVLKPHVDYLIVSTHWGPNWGYSPPREHIPFAHALIDAGADLVFGHSGHIFRGVESYKRRPIIYCAGDFIDDYAVDEIERNDESMIFCLELCQGNEIIIDLYPSYISNFQAHIAEGCRRTDILKTMDGLCRQLGTHLKLNAASSYIEIT